MATVFLTCFRLAIQAIKQLHPDVVASVQSKALFSKREEEILGRTSSVGVLLIGVGRYIGMGFHVLVEHYCNIYSSGTSRIMWALLSPSNSCVVSNPYVLVCDVPPPPQVIALLVLMQNLKVIDLEGAGEREAVTDHIGFWTSLNQECGETYQQREPNHVSFRCCTFTFKPFIPDSVSVIINITVTGKSTNSRNIPRSTSTEPHRISPIAYSENFVQSLAAHETISLTTRPIR